jgi:hypothetical protein
MSVNLLSKGVLLVVQLKTQLEKKIIYLVIKKLMLVVSVTLQIKIIEDSRRANIMLHGE